MKEHQAEAAEMQSAASEHASNDRSLSFVDGARKLNDEMSRFLDEQEVTQKNLDLVMSV